MSSRKVKLFLFLKSETPDAFEEQNDNVQAFCTMNNIATAFHVYKFEPLFFGKPEFVCSIDLVCTKSFRKYGEKRFHTIEAAIAFGKQFVVETFPELIEKEDDYV